MRYLLFGLATLLCFTDVNAQHYNSWLRTTVKAPLSEQWSTSAEFQSRRQNNVSDSNPFSESLLYSYRHWISFKHNESITFSVSPFAYYRSYKIITEETDRQMKPSTEYRFTLAMAMQHPIYKTLYITDRTASEYRTFDGKDNIVRLRNRLGLHYDLHAHWMFDVYHELLLNTNTHPHSYLDHERLGIMTAYRFNQHLTVQLGFMHIKRLHESKPELMEESNFIMNISYCLAKLH